MLLLERPFSHLLLSVHIIKCDWIVKAEKKSVLFLSSMPSLTASMVSAVFIETVHWGHHHSPFGFFAAVLVLFAHFRWTTAPHTVQASVVDPAIGEVRAWSLSGWIYVSYFCFWVEDFAFVVSR